MCDYKLPEGMYCNGKGLAATIIEGQSDEWITCPCSDYCTCDNRSGLYVGFNDEYLCGNCDSRVMDFSDRTIAEIEDRINDLEQQGDHYPAPDEEIVYELNELRQELENRIQ
jgi:hypothetical protein